jgi:hypothetical protein
VLTTEPLALETTLRMPVEVETAALVNDPATGEDWVAAYGGGDIHIVHAGSGALGRTLRTGTLRGMLTVVSAAGGDKLVCR